MAEGGQDDSQKTEDPSQKRLEDARKKGQIAFSREVSNFFILLALCVILIALLPFLLKQFTLSMFPYIAKPEDITRGGQALWLTLNNTLQEIGLVLAIPLAVTTIAALTAGLMQTRFNVSLERITPKLEKISIIKGLKRMFSMRSVVEFLKGIIKITIVGFVAYLAVAPYMDKLPLLSGYAVEDMMDFLYVMSVRIAIGVTVTMLLIAVLDYSYQRFEYMKNLRMTKQEVKDEYKQQEGDPQIKAKLRQIRVQRSKQRMMANVPKADVVITNPTHYAVALSYDSQAMQAPIVLAKGKDKVALRIREIAEEHKIVIYRNPPIARALFDNAEIDQEIPYEYYQAVAKIIGYVYRLKGKKARKK